MKLTVSATCGSGPGQHGEASPLSAASSAEKVLKRSKTIVDHARNSVRPEECTELPPYADALRYFTGLPLWDARVYVARGSHG